MHTEKYDKGKVHLVSLISFFFGFFDAYFIYILSSYFSLLYGNKNVGIFYFVAYTIVLLSLFYLQPLIRTIGRARALYLFLGLSLAAAALLAATPNDSFIGILAALFLIAASNITWVVLDIMLEGFSSDAHSGSIRGLHLTIMNAGFIIAPFLSLWTLTKFDYSGVFLVLVIGYTGVFILSLLGFRSDNRIFQQKLHLRSTIAKMFRERNLLSIFQVSFAMEFFYSLMIIYTPIYLRELGYSWENIGVIFTVMLIPFVLLQYPIGVLADRYFGEKEMLIGSIVIATVATFLLPLIGVGGIFLWAAALFATRIGIAGIEVLRDSYFYKQIDGNDLDVIAFFRTTRPLANMLGALLSFVLLLIFPLWSVFFLIAAVLFLSLWSACSLRDTVSLRDEESAGL